MHHAGLDLLGLAHVPEVFTQVAAGTAGDVHLGLVLVVTGRALPLKVGVELDLAVVAAALAVVALGVELGVLDVVVDEADHILQGLQVVAHVGDLHIGDTAAGGNLLELALEGELIEGIDGLADVNMITIGIITLISYIEDSTKAFLVNACEAVAQALDRKSVV